ncbi:hypothetical protein [Flavobacterium noncentrifugens]|uniref:hypothetical protein n=1 Tax=Flavobacterium noncentrifugens TaxID=1128970 RepID=UPI0011144891|nr:hypothetical protein [Flavobacterium noncentrifugens]
MSTYIEYFITYFICGKTPIKQFIFFVLWASVAHDVSVKPINILISACPAARFTIYAAVKKISVRLCNGLQICSVRGIQNFLRKNSQNVAEYPKPTFQ